MRQESAARFHHASAERDPVGCYISEAARTPLLDRDEERRLARLMARRRTAFFHAACAVPDLWPRAIRIVREVLRGERPAMKAFNIGGLTERDFHAHLRKLSPAILVLANLQDFNSRESYVDGRNLMTALKLRPGLLCQMLRAAESKSPECRDGRWRLRRARMLHRRFVQARNALVSANLRLVVHVAKQVARHPSQMLELIQEGNVGLLYATEKYDAREECQFHSYAYWWIKQSMTRAIASKWRLIRQPVNLEEAPARVKEAVVRYRAKHGHDPTPYELAGILDITRGQAQRVFRTVVHSLSIDHLTGEEASLHESLAAADDRPLLDVHSIQDGVERVLETLLPREREVVRMRFGLKDDDAYTLEDIAKIYNLSRERVRQIELKALEKLRQPSRARRLREILDSLD